MAAAIEVKRGVIREDESKSEGSIDTNCTGRDSQEVDLHLQHRLARLRHRFRVRLIDQLPPHRTEQPLCLSREPEEEETGSEK